MRIYGLRFYPQCVTVARGRGGPIYTHGRLSPDRTDFAYIFRPLMLAWGSRFFATDFAVSCDEKGEIIDPIPQLTKRFGATFFAADVRSQIMLVRDDGSGAWASSVRFQEGAFVPVFSDPPAFDLLNRLYWDREFRLTSRTWPAGLDAVLHMWDDIYWQLFTTANSDVERLLRAHANDQRLRIYYVDFDREYPDPSNQELKPVRIDVVES